MNDELQRFSQFNFEHGHLVQEQVDLIVHGPSIGISARITLALLAQSFPRLRALSNRHDDLTHLKLL